MSWWIWMIIGIAIIDSAIFVYFTIATIEKAAGAKARRIERILIYLIFVPIKALMFPVALITTLFMAVCKILHVDNKLTKSMDEIYDMFADAIDD